MRLIPVSFSMVVSLVSGISMIGFPAETYLYGGMMMLMVLGEVMGFTLAAIFIVPVLHRLRLTSVYQVRFHYYNYIEYNFYNKI